MRRLHLTSVLSCAIAAWLSPTAALAQGEVVVLTQMEARQRLQHSPAPLYPMIAQAARVTGVVNIDVTIAPDGEVVRALSMGGPPMLDAAALDGVAAWRFQPLATPAGVPFTARTVISVFYGIPASEPLVDYADALLRCAAGIEFGAFAGALPHCETARSLETAPDGRLRQEPRSTLFLGLALVGLERHDEAIKLLTAALRTQSTVLTDRARAELGLARVHRAQGDLRRAVDRYSNAYTRLRDLYNASNPAFSLGDYCADQMRLMTPEYVALLEELGRQRDADRVKSRTDALRADKRRPLVPPVPPSRGR